MNTILGIGAELNWNLSLWHFQKKTLIDPFEYDFLKIKYSATFEKFSKPNLKHNQNKVQVMHNISAASV